MKKFVCVIISCAILTVQAFSQRLVNDKINLRVSELRELGIDTFIRYHPYCVGCTIQFNNSDTSLCRSYDREYLVWTKSGKNFIQYFDQCYTYNPIANKVGSLIEIVKNHLTKIEKEKIKPVQYQQVINGKKEISTTYIDHAYHWDFQFYIKQKFFEKGLDDFTLNTPNDNYFNNPTRKTVLLNINYAYNQKTYLKHLVDITEQTVKELHFQKQ